MSITIGEQTLATTRPDDLDDRLIAATGCMADEHARMLAKGATPFQIARVLHPMLVDDMSVPALAEAIGDADAVDVARQTVALLSAPVAPAPSPTPTADFVVGG